MAVYIDLAAVVRRKEWAAHLRPLVAEDLTILKRLLLKNRKAVLEPGSPSDVERLLAGLLAWKKAAGNPKILWVFCDEIHNYGDPWNFPLTTRLFTMGRNFNLVGIAITQNLPQLRNPAIVTNCQTKILFSLDDAAVWSLRRNYGVIVPPDVLDYINVEASLIEGKRKTYNAAVYGLSGREWIRI